MGPREGGEKGRTVVGLKHLDAVEEYQPARLAADHRERADQGGGGHVAFGLRQRQERYPPATGYIGAVVVQAGEVGRGQTGSVVQSARGGLDRAVAGGGHLCERGP